MGKILKPPHMATLLQKTLQLNLVKNTMITADVKRIPSVLPCRGWGIGDFIYQIVLQSIYITKKYERKKYFNIYN